MLNWKRLGLIGGLSLSLFAAGCGGSDEATTEKDPADSGDDTNTEQTTNYGDELGFKITGIEAGAGVFKAAEAAVEEYGLDGWEVQASSSGAMATALGEAYEKEEPIIVTAWEPHWKFSKYDMKFLDDPKEVFGGEETIETMVREGLEEDLPGVYKFLDNFKWTLEDVGPVMLENIEGADPVETAAKWVEENPDLVDEWTEGVEEGNGEEVELVYVEWDDAIVTHHVAAKVLEDLGYKATITPLDNAVMWQSVANGEVDGMMAAWLPGTHGDLYEEYKDQVVELGPNLEGAKIGLAVPTYMDIDSIEDLAE